MVSRTKFIGSVAKTMANAMNGFSRNITRYEEAVNKLNSLQSNNAYIKAPNIQARSLKSLPNTIKYLLRSGIMWDQLNRLSIIHVAGTKGKGSTCAYVESILRECKYSTGFYSSPHLINVRERFKINGQSISEPQFTYYFNKVYNALHNKREDSSDMPMYFQFLTIMMFNLFIEADLDVAIIEVGIGGEHDCTNIIKNPVCTGITSLGLDHVSILGNTLDQIAFQKAGIFKENAPGFTTPQPREAMRVLEERAVERNCSLKIVPPLESYAWPNGVPKLGIDGEAQKYNASLAIQLSNSWLKSVKLKESESQNLSIPLEQISKGISNCKWLGRTQVLPGRSMDFFLDGAHTTESIDNCAIWFESKVKDRTSKRFLIFNVMNRDPRKFLDILKRLNFYGVYFTPNVAGCVKKFDQVNVNANSNDDLEKCRKNKDYWGKDAEVAESVGEAIVMISSLEYLSTDKPSVLITGSLHLVGSALAILDPDFTMKTDI